MEIAPLQGKSAGFRPGRVTFRPGEEHRKAYAVLYGQYRTIFDSLPVLRERDFDGRPVTVTVKQLDALNRALASLNSPEELATRSPFDSQEQAKNRLFKRLQYLS